MRIDCPSCAAAYEVPASVLTARRVMRCARCGAEFTPQAAATPPQAPEAAAKPALVQSPTPAAPETLAMPDDRMGLSVLPREQAAAPRRAAVLAAWLLSFVLLGAGAWAAIAWRGPIMHAWPASARLYMALGYTS